MRRTICSKRNLLDNLSSLHKELYGFDDSYLVERVSQCIAHVIPFLQRRKSISVADFGCGDLRASNLIYAQLVKKFNVTSFYCVDIAPIVDKTSIFKILQHDLNWRGLEIPDDSVDFAYALEVIEHLWNIDVFISEVYRILKVGGVFLVTTPNLTAWYNRILFLLGILPVHYEVSFKKKYGRVFSFLGDRGKSVGHIRLFTPLALSKLLEDNGFEILKCKGLQFIFNGLGSILDKAFNFFPSLSSMFLVLAKKVVEP